MNDNSLAGKACPKCGSEEPFAIAVTALAKVWDSGPDDFEQVEWDDRSVCRCCQCGFLGTVADFTLVDSGLEVEDDRDPAVVDFCWPNATSRRGAQMGRTSTIPEGTSEEDVRHLEITASDWVDGDYDAGGAYWGSGIGHCDLVWCAYNRNRGIRIYVRSATESDALDTARSYLLANLRDRA